MRLRVGEAAPTFVGQTCEGGVIDSGSLHGGRIWLSFYRYAACPLCCFRIHELMSQWRGRFAHHEFNAITVWQSPVAKLRNIQERYRPEFALISDPSMELYTTFGVETGLLGAFGKEVFEGLLGARSIGVPVIAPWDGAPTRRPADFLIDEHGVIQAAFYGGNVAQMIPLDQVDAFLAKS